jgi:hypothetical protein
MADLLWNAIKLIYNESNDGMVDYNFQYLLKIFFVGYIAKVRHENGRLLLLVVLCSNVVPDVVRDVLLDTCYGDWWKWVINGKIPSCNLL